MIKILQGDALEMLKTLPDESVNCCVTSPPYYGLRDYGVSGQIGLESSPEQYIERLVAVFREVRRVLCKDGTLWLNIGDSYAANGARANNNGEGASTMGWPGQRQETLNKAAKIQLPSVQHGCKPKDLIGIPWMLAFALRADGWFLRQDIIWAKPNPMPESVRDRCTKSHEYIFLLTKSARYCYDAEAVQEPIADSTANDSRLYRDGYETNRIERGFPGGAQHGAGMLMPRSFKGSQFNTGKTGEHQLGRSSDKPREIINENMRNRRSVWTITTKPYSDAHFATFPPDLPRICIMAGCPATGTVLDPFAGSGTTGKVALELGRQAILIELNEKYISMIRRRTTTTAGMAL